MSSGAGSEDNLPEMANIDHRHLQMWKWLHSSNAMQHHHMSTTTNTNTETSLESSMSNSFDFSADMSRSIDSSISSSRILTSPMPITSFVTTNPSTSSFLPSNSVTAQTYHDIYSLALPYLQAPPPPYTAPPGLAHPASSAHSHAASTLLLLHKMAADAAAAAASTSDQPSEESSEDIDVVGLSLNDKDEEDTEMRYSGAGVSNKLAVDTQQPLDLSYKLTQNINISSPTTSAGIFRPTVIIDHHSSNTCNHNVEEHGSNESGSSKTHTSVRRSMSSVSEKNPTKTHEDIANHFRRSLSGKWPKRCNKYEENRNSPLRRRPSFNTHSSISSLSTLSISPTPPPLQSAAPTPTPTPTPVVVQQPQQPTSKTSIINHCADTSLSVADHFRRALFGKKGAYDLMKSQKS